MIIELFGKRILTTGKDASTQHSNAEGIQHSNIPTPEAYYGGYSYNNVWSVGYDGEKNLGELGPIIDYRVNFAALRTRSWQLYLESEVCQMVFRRFTRWVIGTGLKLQATPKKEVLAGEGITLEAETFNKIVEARFSLFAAAKESDWAGMKSLHTQARRGFLEAIVGGDALVIQRYAEDGWVKVQIVDGAHVATPPDKLIDPNVRHGVQLDERGQHLGYYVRKAGTLMDYEYVAARGKKSGSIMAFLVYGLEYRLDNVRGLPLIAAVMETAKKLERYKEATLGSAEERAKIAWFIEHGIASTEENPLQKQVAKVAGFLKPGADIPTDVNGNQFANTVAATTNKQVFNMPKDSTIKSVGSSAELQFEPFFTVNIDLVCATVGIPPNVAMMKYDANFSASRAALKDWEHTLLVERDGFSGQFYGNVYNLWLDTEILKNKVAAPGYLSALAGGNTMAVLAYRACRWAGANVPHIDPLKEVKAEREKLGPAGAHLPLTTQEAATEALSSGDSTSNTEQFASELKKADDEGIEPVQPPGAKPEPPEGE